MAKFMYVFRGGGYAPGGLSPTELARGCPILDMDGSVEVRTALVIPGK